MPDLPDPTRPPGTALTDAEIAAVRRGRLARLREEMAAREIGAVVLVDPVNVRYATGTRNMQIFSARNPARYVFVPVAGPVVMFEFAGCGHVSEGYDTVDEVRIAKTASYVACAERIDTVTDAWAEEIADLARAHGGGSRRVGVERFNAAAVFSLLGRGLEVVDAQEPVERARARKLPGEIAMMREGMRVVEDAVEAMRAAIRPGATENAIWSVLWQRVIEAGGDYVETRLLSSGPRTNPWFREASAREVRAGELVCLDTDVVGPHGYYVDFSRSWLCGDVRPGAAQRERFRLAYDQVHHNLDQLRPGMTFGELSERGWVIPERYVRHRYYVLAHGIGMTGEYPYVLYDRDHREGGYDGVVEPGTMLCFESFIGAEDGGEGVKLEEQVLVTETGWERISNAPYDEALLGREL